MSHGTLSMDAVHKHYETIALELEDDLDSFEHINIVLDASFGRYEFCTGSLGLDLYLYTTQEYMKLDLGDVKLVSKADLLESWTKTKLPRYADRTRPAKSSTQVEAPKISLSLDDLGL